VLGSPSYDLYACNDVFLARKRDLPPDDD
jgi:hypothetical protein